MSVDQTLTISLSWHLLVGGMYDANFLLTVDDLEAGKLRKELSEFDKVQTVMARKLGQSFPKTAALVGRSWSAVVTVVNRGTGDQG